MEDKTLLEIEKENLQKIYIVEKILSIKNKYKNYNRNKTLNKKIKARNPSIDFVRILSTYAIIIQHILVHGNLFIKYKKYKELVLMHISCSWPVSSYALISGYIGYKTNKYSNLLYLYICVFFYSIGITYIFGKYFLKSNTEKIKFSDYFPFYFEKYWYFTKYFGMYLFLPVINKGIANLAKNELRFVVMSLILIYVILKDIINPNKDILVMNSGYSVIWLLIFYLTGAFFGKFRIKEYNGIKKFIFMIIFVLIFHFSTYFCFYFLYYSLDNIKCFLKMKIIQILKQLFIPRINSLPMILQSIFLTILLTEIKYNKYLTKIIIFFGPLTFGIYLIHTHPIIFYHIIKKIFEKESNNISLSTVIKLVLIKSLKIFGICAIIDYIRHILFSFLRIRKLCLLAETILFY